MISLFCSYSYFRILVEQFEVQLQQYRQQIEELENHLATQANNSHITPQGKCFNFSVSYIKIKKSYSYKKNLVFNLLLCYCWLFLFNIQK